MSDCKHLFIYNKDEPDTCLYCDSKRLNKCSDNCFSFNLKDKCTKDHHAHAWNQEAKSEAWPCSLGSCKMSFVKDTSAICTWPCIHVFITGDNKLDIQNSKQFDQLTCITCLFSYGRLKTIESTRNDGSNNGSNKKHMHVFTQLSDDKFKCLLCNWTI